MKCPNCYFENKENVKVCANCGEIFEPSSEPGQRPDDTIAAEIKQHKRRGSFGRFLAGLVSGVVSFIVSMLVLILVIAILLGVLIYQCRLNIPIPPEWAFLPKVVVQYWDWADEWQMERCPDLSEGNYFFGDEPLPKFDNSGEVIPPPPMCEPASITFSPWSAPAGTTFEISLDGFAPNENIHACWYFPSSALVNCTDLESDDQGHRETVYWSTGADPKGVYRMDAFGDCASGSVEWTIE